MNQKPQKIAEENGKVQDKKANPKIAKGKSLEGVGSSN